MSGFHSVFIVTGEVSGDRIGAWYLARLRAQHGARLHVEAVGGAFLRHAGAHLYAENSSLNVVGIAEIVKHAPRILKFLKQLAHYIVENKFAEVVLVDFPGFNLRLAKLLKKLVPTLKITYCSPPQLWVWGAWRIKTLKGCVDEVVVLYPFEVEWYKKRGVNAHWYGYPGYELFAGYNLKSSAEILATKKPRIALIMGSRMSEIESMCPLFVQVALRLKAAHPELEFIVPVAQSFASEFLEKEIVSNGLARSDFHLVISEEEKNKQLATCVAALAKPGTMTLHLAFLAVPTIVAFKTSFLTFLLGKPFVKVRYMGLPNLLLNEEVAAEFIQGAAVPEKIAPALEALYRNYKSKQESYTLLVSRIKSLHTLLGS